MTGNDCEPEALNHYVQMLANSVMEEISRPKLWHNITSLAYELLVLGTLSGEQVRARPQTLDPRHCGPMDPCWPHYAAAANSCIS